MKPPLKWSAQDQASKFNWQERSSDHPKTHNLITLPLSYQVLGPHVRPSPDPYTLPHHSFWPQGSGLLDYSLQSCQHPSQTLGICFPQNRVAVGGETRLPGNLPHLAGPEDKLRKSPSFSLTITASLWKYHPSQPLYGSIKLRQICPAGSLYFPLKDGVPQASFLGSQKSEESPVRPV